MHAGVTDQRSWPHVVDALPEHRCLTTTPAATGGRRTSRRTGWSAVDDALAVLDAYDVGSAVVIGSSMGGRTSLDLALTHPERVRALVLIGPAVSGAPGADVRAGGPRARRRVGGRRGARRPGDAQPARGPRLARRPDGARGSGDGRGPRPLPGDERAAPWTPTTRGATRRRRRLGPAAARSPSRPWCWSASTTSRYIKRRTAPTPRARSPGARLVELPGVAHLPHLEGDERTLAEIAAFVAPSACGRRRRGVRRRTADC